MRRPIALLVGLLVICSGVAVAAGTVAATDVSQTTNETANETHPPDPPTDRLGWEDGYWYNETITVTREDGLNDSELDAVVARGMARVERVRGLEFEEVPPVEVISREEFRNETSDRYADVNESQRVAENVYYEALFMINESADAVDVQESNTAGGVGGYYSPGSEAIKIVSENTSTPKMNEITLSQELFHALQDQHFNLSKFDYSTREAHNANDGIVEGDGNYVDHLYNQRCQDEWNETCLLPEESGGGDSDFDPHLGLYQIRFQPYSTGPAFVRQIREEGGWEAVNAVYENPPESTEQTIHPEKYGVDSPTNVTVEDTASGDWERLEVNGSADYESFGEAGLFVALWYPGYESQLSTTIIPYQAHLNQDGGSLDSFQPALYNHSYTAGWDGDKIVPYVRDDSLTTNETGYVYKLVWDTEDDAAEFVDGYQQLLEFHGAEPVDGNRSTYRIPDEQGFSDAFYVGVNGTTVTIVNAPTVADLSGVHAGAAPAAQTGGTPTLDSTTVSDNETTDDTGSGFGPGFGAVVALVAVLASALLATRRRG